MQDKSTNPLGLAPNTWITLAIAVMGVFAFKQYPFHDTRPPDQWVPTYSHTATEDQDVEARLWQDPLSAVETARKVDDAALVAKVAEEAAKAAKDVKHANPPEKTPEMFNCPDALATQAAAAAAGAKAAAKAPTKPPVTGPTASLQLRDGVHSASHLCDSIDHKLAEHSSVLVVGVIVSGAPYAADIETRRRMRYAVLAGLYRSGYMPVNNQHVGYVRLSQFYNNPIRANDLAAFEWFVSSVPGPSSRPANVLLLWLDQDGFRFEPIRQFSTIADGLLPHGVHAVILGPADSDGLRALAEEYKAQKHPDPKLPAIRTPRRIDIYSPRATAADDVIVHGDFKEDELRQKMQISVVTVRLYRTIATDSAVADMVRKELGARQIELREIALVAERDTLYGRSMGQYFQNPDNPALKGCGNPPRDNAGNPTPYTLSLPLCLTYLKGLDGIGPPPPKQAGATSVANSNQAKGSDQPSHADSAPEASTGPRQLDYLRRMGAALRAMQGAPVSPKCKPIFPTDCKPRYIKAIGVLGTDIYDKLLVLQELRPMFPDVVFFTFGLDARYTDDENLPWTRRLLVGSSLGLSLREELQGDIPAFRDGYQSATFYSTLLALHRASFPVSEANRTEPSANTKNVKEEDEKGLQWTAHPMVFEIGRRQPLDLNMEPQDHDDCNLNDKCPSIAATRSTIFYDAVTQRTASWVILLAPVFLWTLLCMALGTEAMHRRRGLRFVTLTTIIAMLALAGAVAMQLTSPWHAVLAYFTRNGSHMPIPIADGAGEWGKELLEVCFMPLIIALLIRGQRQLTLNAEHIREHFGLHEKFGCLIERYASEVHKSSAATAREWLYFPISSLSSKREEIPALLSTSPLEALIARYLYRGVWQRRWRRVVVATTVFILVLRFLEWLGFSLFSDVPWVLTQSEKHGIEGRIAFFCFTFMQLLIFWVVDAILLTRAFLLDVSHLSPAWPTDIVDRNCKDLRLTSELTQIWLALRLIARRTGWVSGFIWYPSLVIAGMFAATFTVDYGRYRFDSNPVTFLASVAMIVGSVVALRRAAESWRDIILRKLAHRRLALLAAKSPDTSSGKAASASSNVDAVSQVQLLSDLVTQLHDGAFAPYSEQPLVRAMLLPAVTFTATAGFPFLHPG